MDVVVGVRFAGWVGGVGGRVVVNQERSDGMFVNICITCVPVHACAFVRVTTVILFLGFWDRR